MGLEKCCTKCGQVKQLKEFGPAKQMRDGYRNECRKCIRRLYEEPYRQANRERDRERLRRYRQEQPETVNATNRRYREANRETVREWDRRRIAKFTPAERVRYLAQRAYYSQVRRARDRAAHGSFTLAEWLELCEFWGYRCLACSKQVRLSVDHVLPLIAGGTNDIGNVQPLCQPCNSNKGVKIIDYRLTTVNLRSTLRI